MKTIQAIMKNLVSTVKKIKNFIYNVKEFDCPQQLSSNHRTLTDDAKEKLRKSLVTNYFSYRDYFPQPPEIYLASKEGHNDYCDHLINRLERDRKFLIPWIDNICLPVRSFWTRFWNYQQQNKACSDHQKVLTSSIQCVSIPRKEKLA
ncbi:hypothetical protein IQ225_06135 [Synechocystis salina LEGE 06155]|nr:hypothetical protein [Synechocystis salina LEGE 06155]